MRQRLFGRGKVLDYWSIPHFFFGTVTALSAITFSWSIPLTFFGTIVIAIVWEFLEMGSGLRETDGNKIADVVLPLLSFWLTLVLVDRSDQNLGHNSSLLAVAIVVYLSLNFFAWRARFDHDREFSG